MQKRVHLFAQISKIDESKREVWGVATSEIVDKEGEIFDYPSSKPYFKSWSDEIAKATDGKSLGNVREMHESSAVGKLIEIGFDDELKEVRVGAKIIDDEAWQKCIQGVYTGFSIGGTYVKAWKDGEYTRYTAKPVEISVVDNPCNPGAHFTAVKADGSWEVRKFAANLEPAPKLLIRRGGRKGERENMEKVGAKHSAETRAHHEALNQCVNKIAQACADAQDHVEALLGKDDADAGGAVRPAFTKQYPAEAQPETEAGDQSMNEQHTKDLEKAATDSALALAKVTDLENSVAVLRAEMKRGLDDLGQALSNLTGAIAKLTGNPGDATPKAARAPVPSFTVTKEDDGRRGEKNADEEKSVHELLKRALQNPQRASAYLR
jgi:uncharacterized small protein (DUF1192 family)